MYKFTPDYRNILDVLFNRRPARLPLYEHHIDIPFIEKLTGKSLALQANRPEDYRHYYSQVVRFWKDMTYDAVDYEAAICDIYPDHGAIMGGRPGPVQNRDDFNRYPFDEIPGIFWKTYKPHLDALRAVMPAGMKAYGGCGYGIFESAEDLVGFEQLCVMEFTDPELFSDLFQKIGDLYIELWTEMVRNYSDVFVFFRMGDDLGYKTSTMLAPDTIRKFILPQYRRIIDLVHASDKKFLLHSCGCIFDVMDDIIDLGIDAKHSNEDQIAPFDRWIELYNRKIGLLGGIDMNILCLNSYDDIFREVVEKGTLFRSKCRGYGLGSGNSIPSYIPVDGFMAMIDAAIEIRRCEKN